MVSICRIDGCDKRVKARSLCSRHYRRLRETGDPLSPPKNNPAGRYAFCTVEDCDRPHLARGYCTFHYWRLRNHGDPRIGVPKGKHVRQVPRKVHPSCALDGCEASSKTGAHGYCSRHYQRIKRLGEVGPIERLTAESGSGHTHKRTGYRLIQVDGKQVKEHRHVMERMIGRPLLPDENVHHRDGNRSNNRPENLELWTTMQPSGKRVVDLVEYAYKILERYPDEVRRALAD